MTLAIYGPATAGGNGIYRSPFLITEALAAAREVTRRVFRPWQAASGNAIYGPLVGISPAGGYESRSKRKAAKKTVVVKAAPATTSQQTHKYAELLTASGKLTKATKKKRREEVEREVLELLPDSPGANDFAASIAQAVVRREAQFLAAHLAEPASAGAIEHMAKFDPQPVIKEMIARWKPPVVRHPDDEFEVE